MADEIDAKAVGERVDGLLETIVVERLDGAVSEEHVMVVLAVGLRSLVPCDPVAGVEPMDKVERAKRVERAVHGGQVRTGATLGTQAVNDVVRGEHTLFPGQDADDGRAPPARAEAGLAQDTLGVFAPADPGFRVVGVVGVRCGVSARGAHAAACTGLAHCHSSPKLRIAAMIGSSASPIAVSSYGSELPR